MPQTERKMPPSKRGGFVGRKRIPSDVREAYGALHANGQPVWEVWWRSGPMGSVQARARYREWLSKIESQIANIRAERKGDGRTLPPQEARALAAEWYHWYVARMAALNWPAPVWADYQARMWRGLDESAMMHGMMPGALDAGTGMVEGAPLDHWERDDDMRAHVRPIISDEAKVQTFLADKRLVLDAASRDLFVDCVVRDYVAAVALLARRARGDHGEDEHAKRLPKPGGMADPAVTPWSLFEQWITEAAPAVSTINR